MDILILKIKKLFTLERILNINKNVRKYAHMKPKIREEGLKN